ncbi:hypothetical protein COCC4DRAFT_29771, partial [Bipolaris maydis ATCC 48331]
TENSTILRRNTTFVRISFIAYRIRKRSIKSHTKSKHEETFSLSSSTSYT